MPTKVMVERFLSLYVPEVDREQARRLLLTLVETAELRAEMRGIRGASAYVVFDGEVSS